MSENDQKFLDGEARAHIKIVLWKTAKLSGGRRGTRRQQQAHQSLQLAGRQAGCKEEPMLNTFLLMRITIGCAVRA